MRKRDIRQITWVLALSSLALSCRGAGVDEGLFDGDDAEVLAKELALSHLDVADVAVQTVALDGLGMAHVKVQQTVGGVPVFGAQAIVHLDSSGQVRSVTDDRLHGVTVDTIPALTDVDAIDEALWAWTGGASDVDADLQVLRHEGLDHLVWRVQIDDFESAEPAMPVIFVDAHTGLEVWRYDNLQTSRNRLTYDGNNLSSLPGTLARTETQGPTGDGPVDDAHDHAGLTWDYYFNEQGRDSYDGSGATIRSTAHHRSNYDNAFWDGSQMVYGDGGTYFYPLSGALDVVAHELTHAVTERTANLIYSGEPGGLNEGFSDILGATIEAYAQGWVVDSGTWLVGEDIAKPTIGAALRYMDNPPADGYSIDNVADYTSFTDVHYSSGIPNKAFYLTATHSGCDIQRAGAIYYRALTLYMTSSTTFAGARDATVQAATDLYGAGSSEVAAVQAGWEGVGLISLDVIDVQSGLSASTGQELDFQFDTNGATAMEFSMSGGSGDADLYVRHGSAPTTSTFDCRPYLNGNNETCTFNPAQAGTYHVMIRAYSTFSGVTLTTSAAGATPPPPPPPAEVCDDGIDNDLDGATDCADADCAADPACAPPPSAEVCDDGIDNDGDGATDCADSDCAADPSCAPPPPPPAEVCGDGIDNDLDGATDCADSDCSSDPACVSCPGGEYVGTLSSSNKNDYFADGYAASGLWEAALTGDAGTNFDLYLEYFSGSRWRTRQSSTSSDSNEQVSYNEGSVVEHRWRIRRRSGTGSYSLCIESPQ